MPLLSVAQEYPRKDVNLERLVDELFGFQDQDLNYEDLYENLALLLANPLNLNKATAEELRFVNILSEEQLQNLLSYRNENGPFLSVYELQAIPGIDLPTIYRIIPFVAVYDPATTLNASLWQRMLKEGNTYLIARFERTLETRRGFTDAATEPQRFLGDANKIYMRFRSSRAGDYSIGFTVEKDAGEQVLWTPNQKQFGFDYNSFHAQVMNKGKIKNLIVGDYQAQFAQGLLLGSNFGFGKGAETITTIRRSNLGFLPYTSINETGYLRGTAVTYEASKNILVSGFYSNTWRDATILSDTIEGVMASAFQTTGLHRNIAELNRRKTIQEQQLGFILNYQNKKVDAGLIYHGLSYHLPVNRNSQPYNQFSFSGSILQNLGGFLNYTVNNFTFFSEAGKTISGGVGLSAGLLGSVTNQLDISLHYRNYQRNFHSFYSNAFAEGSMPQNERGLYWGWRYRWNRKYNMTGYMDIFRFPWLRYRSYSPSTGYEYLLRFNYHPSRNIHLFVQLREESKDRNRSGSDNNLYLTDTGIKRNYWLNADYRINQVLSLKTRAQFSSYSINQVTTYGMIVLQDISINFNKLSLTMRYALFDSDDFDNRQYVFERDVWLAFSMPAFSGTGIRNYALLQYDFTKRFTLWIRYAHIRYTDRQTIGSGADRIDGNIRNDIKLQCRIRL
ncbi:MAG: helix-hairpin-helix domain-containing protein [Cyclobacteriaceae bacterium]|nr:helix-hairpin-helix domain-containing protein [Cyclobacteriaceae bacterium]UYN88107.1 MAG: helix-hairpin-helix domain-containing protein [Cyclobacteriaceae bacterium]